MIDIQSTPQLKKKRRTKGLIIVGVLFVFVAIAISLFFISLFSSVILEEEKIVTIPSGYSIIQTGSLLESENLIRSGHAFRLLAQKDNVSIKSGPYFFSSGTHTLTDIVGRLSRADYGDVYATITIPEGSTNQQIAAAIERSIFDYDEEKFIELAQDMEGYLFPDTYSFLPEANTQEIVTRLRAEFDKKIAPLESEIKSSGRTLEDIVIMASIIEKEATGDLEEKRIVSGILWKRLDEGKLLQVDAPFQYINGEVRAADLRKDGPYNTYTRLGLTPTAIGNPGIDSLKAAVNPQSSPYYFYLHGKDGVIRYGKNYNEHLNNINRYLR